MVDNMARPLRIEYSGAVYHTTVSKVIKEISYKNDISRPDNNM